MTVTTAANELATITAGQERVATITTGLEETATAQVTNTADGTTFTDEVSYGVVTTCDSGIRRAILETTTLD